MECEPGASDFLETIPSITFGLAFKPREFVTELRRRLIIPVYEKERFCPRCAGILDIQGRHPAVCGGGSDRITRHNAVRNTVFRLTSTARLGPVLEKPGLLPPSPDHPWHTDARRPADVYIPVWEAGEPVAMDFAITSPQRQDILFESAECGSATETAYERVKRTFLNTASACAEQGLGFIPMVASPAGGWGPAARKALQAIAKASAAFSGEPEKKVVQRQRQLLCVVLRRANARAIIDRDGGDEVWEGRLAAQETLASTATSAGSGS